MAIMRPSTLFIYAKPPRIGLAKTRLAAGLGAATARRIAGLTLTRTLHAARASGLNIRIYTAPDRMTWLREGQAPFGQVRLHPQGQGGLTERLARGLHEAPPGPVIFIGSDAPDISAALLRAAILMLSRHDAVFGPASDGGFWLFGLHKGPRTRSPFSGVRWSGPHAMEDVWGRLPPHARIGLLTQLIDIDEACDWRDWTEARRKSHRKRFKSS